MRFQVLNVIHRAFLQHFQDGVPRFRHDRVDAAGFLIAVFAAFIEVKAYTTDKGNRSIDCPYYPRKGYFFRMISQEITSTTPTHTDQYIFIAQLQKNGFEELYRYLPLTRNGADQNWRLILVMTCKMGKCLERILSFLTEHSFGLTCKYPNSCSFFILLKRVTKRNTIRPLITQYRGIVAGITRGREQLLEIVFIQQVPAPYK